jgi:tRNA(Ile)-lysidine synthase TilS/MesJ
MSREEWEIRGWCDTCQRHIYLPDQWCESGHIIDTSWQARINPLNEKWMPGYRFKMLQSAKTGRSTTKMTLRTYHVFLGLDRNGKLEWQGGVKPTPETWAIAEELYANSRPGSNYYPGWEYDL